MERFQGTKDYKLTLGIAYLGTGTGSGTAVVELPDYAEQVDLITDIFNIAAANAVGITVLQNNTSDTTGASTLSLPASFATQTGTGQKKYRLQPSLDTATLFPWKGPVDGKYLFVEVDVTGTNTTQTSYMLGAVLTIQSREYPVE